MDYEHIKKRCHHHGLLIREAHVKDDVLVLVPESFDVIPPALRLQALAEELESDGEFKHVALEVAEEDG
ncbi:MAG: hypothetical protein ACQEVA_19225 [Myxococcota bacterium]